MWRIIPFLPFYDILMWLWRLITSCTTQSSRICSNITWGKSNFILPGWSLVNIWCLNFYSTTTMSKHWLCPSLRPYRSYQPTGFMGWEVPLSCPYPQKGFTHISGVLDLFFPLKNSGRARRSMTWMLQQKQFRLRLWNSPDPKEDPKELQQTSSLYNQWHFSSKASSEVK